MTFDLVTVVAPRSPSFSKSQCATVSIQIRKGVYVTRTELSPLDVARVLHADLCAGRSLVPVTPPVAGLLPEQGEWALGVFAGSAGGYLDYARYYGMDVVFYGTGPSVVMGSPHFLVGYALGAVVQRA